MTRLEGPSIGRTPVPRAVLACVVLSLVVAGAFLRSALAGDAVPAPATADATPAGPRAPWPPSIVALARTLPIQEGGRVMPLAQWARYTLLGLNQRPSVVDSTGRKLEPIEWALDVMFRPEEAAKYAVFVVDTSEVLDAIGYQAADGKKKRDRYSYYDLAPYRIALARKAREFSEVDARKRSTVEGGVVALSGNVRTFVALVELMSAAKFEVSIENVPGLHGVFGEARSVRASDVFERAGRLLEGAPELRSGVFGPGGLHASDVYGDLASFRRGGVHGENVDPDDPRSYDVDDIFKELSDPRSKGAVPMLRGVLSVLKAMSEPKAADSLALVRMLADSCGPSRLLALVPPEGTRTEDEAWNSSRGLFDRALSRGGLDAGTLAAHRDLEAAVRAAATDDLPKFTRAFQDFHGRTTARATARGEYGKVGLEVFLLRLDPFFWARLLYLLAFVLVAVTWIWRQRFVVWATWGLVLAGLAVHVAGIVLRCVLHSRPPVTTLYETTLFISAFGVLGFSLLERIHQRGFGLALAPLFGTIGLFISNRYETASPDDSMPELVAVLDTNFWLATHVTAVSIGYSATLIASGIAHIQVLASLFGWKKDDADFHRSITKATYGTMAFALVFSTVGTILGGIWANDSWGRFWGWDPKENGALLIVLAQLAVLHGRMGGFLKAQGVALGTIACGCVVAFSWWGVNLLGVGLHAYGFTAGLWTGLLTFWGIEALVLAAGILIKRPA